jgi:AcrR family transcriptional regulator
MPSTASIRRRARAPRRGATGPLPERLIDAAEALLARDGLEGLSLRGVARRAGVTHGAPLRHYPSFAALLAEVAARGFERLAEQVEAYASAVPAGAGARARLAAGARAYLACALEQPGRFALMFRPELVDVSDPRFASESRAAFEGLVRLVRAAQDAGWHTARDTRVLAGAVWSAIHGLASLWVQGAYAGAVPNTSVEDALATTIELVLGLDASAPETQERSTP